MCLYAVGSLVGTVERCYISSLSRLVDMEYDSQRPGGNSQFSVPSPEISCADAEEDKNSPVNNPVIIVAM